jgi:hypothetical protein
MTALPARTHAPALLQLIQTQSAAGQCEQRLSLTARAALISHMTVLLSPHLTSHMTSTIPNRVKLPISLKEEA